MGPIDEIVAEFAHPRHGDLAVTDLIVDALTTNETSWFRNEHPVEAVPHHLLPYFFRHIGGAA